MDNPACVTSEVPATIETRVAQPASFVANSTWLLASRVISIVLGGALSVFAIRSFNVEQWGRYSTVVALLAIFGMFTDAGLSTLTLREASSQPEREGQILTLAQSAVALTGSLSLVLMFATAAVLGYLDRPTLLALAGAVLICQTITAPLFAIFNARRVLVYPSILTIAAVVVSTTAGAGLVAAGVGPAGLLIGLFGSQLLSVVGGYWMLAIRLGHRSRPRFPSREVFRFVRAAVPIAVTGGLAVIYVRLDILMLSKIKGNEVVAIYTVPYSLVQNSWLLPAVVGAAYFPILNHQLRTDRELARHSFFLVVRLFLVASPPVVLFLTVAGRSLLVAVFGNQYAASRGVLAILAWASLLGFQSYALWYVILASHLERHVVRYMFGGLVFNAALNALLIPLFGADGAASALIASDLLVILAQVHLVHRRIFAVPWRRIVVPPLIAGAGAGVIVAVGSRFGAIASATGGGLVYIVILLVLGYVTWDEWAPLRAPLKVMVRRFRPATR